MSAQFCVAILLATAILWIAASPLGATTVTYEDDVADPISGAAYDGVTDTALGAFSNATATQNFGQRGDLEVNSRAKNDGGARSILRFDVTSLAGQYQSITSAKLRLYLRLDPGIAAGTNSVVMNELTPANAGWVEGPGISSIASNTYPGSSTWDEKIRGTQGHNQPPNGTGTLWAGSGGASTPGTDYVAAALATTAFDGTEGVGSAMELVFNDPSVIEDWVAGDNPGVRLTLSASSTVRVFFWSSEHAEQSRKPELVIEFEPILVSVERATWKQVKALYR